MKRPLFQTPIFNGVKVDIIIPFHGQYFMTRRLIESILRLTSKNEYKIYLVDDGSPSNGFYKEAEGTAYTKVIRLPEQRGFGASLKAGFDLGSNPYVCFLNSDCTIEHPNWLTAMGEALLNLKSKNVRMVSARSNNPVSDIPELASSRFEKTDDKIVDSPLPLYCTLCHRQLFEKIRGFVKSYPFGGYEDEELYYRMKRFGYKQAIAGSAWVRHEGSATIDELCKNSEIKKIILEDNRHRCINDLRNL